jgi:hypothetical protein
MVGTKEAVEKWNAVHPVPADHLFNNDDKNGYREKEWRKKGGREDIP